MFGIYTSFSEDQIIEGKSLKDILIAAGAFSKAVVGIIILLIAVTIAIPTDMFSSALWYDTFGINIVFDNTSAFFTWISQKILPRQVSVEATGFAVMLFFIQVALQIKMAMSGGWLKNEDVNKRIWIWTLLWRAKKGEVRSETVNWNKVGYAVSSLLLILFDLLTDVEWKIAPGFSFSQKLKVVVLSFFYNNVVSEWGLGIGFLLSVDGITGMIHYGLFNWLRKKKPVQKDNTKQQPEVKQSPNKTHQPNNKPHHNQPSPDNLMADRNMPFHVPEA